MKKFEKKGFDKKGPPKRTRGDAPRTGAAGGTAGARSRSGGGFDRRGSAPAPYEKRRPSSGGFESRDDRRKPAPRGRFESRDSGPPQRRFTPRRPDDAPPVEAQDDESLRDPYQRAQRPRTTGAFTVNLDPDVARVFRGDASVNKALRLVLQLMEVAAPRPPRGAPTGERSFRPAGGAYRGSAEARGFVRKPRFEEEDE